MRQINFLLSILVMTSCVSIQGHYYIRNPTEYPAKVRAIIEQEELTTNQFTSPSEDSTWIIPYVDEVINVNFESVKTFTKHVNVNPIDMARLEFTIPPKSTLFLGYGHNGRFVSGFNQCVIEVNGKETSISMQSATQMNLKRVGVKKYIGSFDIE